MEDFSLDLSSFASLWLDGVPARADELTWSIVPGSVPGLSVEGAFNDFLFEPSGLRGYCPETPPNLILASLGPFSAQECRQVVTGVIGPIWEIVGLTGVNSSATLVVRKET